MLKIKPHILLSNGAAYYFQDHYLAIIKELLSKGIIITFFQHDYYTSPSFYDNLNEAVVNANSLIDSVKQDPRSFFNINISF